MYNKTIEAITVNTRSGKVCIQRKLVESYDHMNLSDIAEFLSARAMGVSGCSQAVDQQTGESTLYLGIEQYGKATYSENLGKLLKGKICWDHLILDGMRLF